MGMRRCADDSRLQQWNTFYSSGSVPVLRHDSSNTQNSANNQCCLSLIATGSDKQGDIPESTVECPLSIHAKCLPFWEHAPCPTLQKKEVETTCPHWLRHRASNCETEEQLPEEQLPQDPKIRSSQKGFGNSFWFEMKESLRTELKALLMQERSACFFFPVFAAMGAISFFRKLCSISTSSCFQKLLSGQLMLYSMALVLSFRSSGARLQLPCLFLCPFLCLPKVLFSNHFGRLVLAAEPSCSQTN